MAASRSCLRGESSLDRDDDVDTFESCRPGGVMEHLRRMSERTVAHWTFLTTRGTMETSSVLPREWLRAQAQCTSLIAG